MDVLPKQHFYEPGLDVLRFVAFLLVFESHAFMSLLPHLSHSEMGGPALDWAGACIWGGSFGVDIFFVLSS